jgi:hypothetical protein
MSFYDRYELLDLARDGEIKTFTARQRDTGRTVSVHLLVGGRAKHPALMDRLEQLPEQARAEILESGEHEGTAFAVTDPWLRTESFQEWILTAKTPQIRGDQFAKAGSWRVPTEEFGKKSAQPAQAEPGEFTRMFQAPRPASQTNPGSASKIMQSPSATPPVPEPAAPKPPGDPEPEPPPEPGPVSTPSVFTSMFEADRARAAQQTGQTAPGPGEFTKQFLSAGSKPVAEQPKAKRRDLEDTVEIVPPPIAAPPSPGEFTRVFRIPSPEPPPPPPPVQKTSHEPGEFTRMFQAPAPPPAQTPSVSEQPSAAPGEFTKFFQAPPPRQEPTSHPAFQDPMGAQRPAGSPGGQPVGEFTRVFGIPGSPAPQPNFAPPPPVQQQPPAPQKPQQGEYTRMFSPASVVQPPPPAAQQGFVPPAQAPARQGPGEFTRVFQAPVPPSALTPPAPAPVAPAPPSQERARVVKKPSYVPLFVGLGILLLIAVVLILVFALRK